LPQTTFGNGSFRFGMTRRLYFVCDKGWPAA
jgi:hypothetical protein